MQRNNHRDPQIARIPLGNELLTQEEAVRLLRLDVLGIKCPRESLRHLRRTGQVGYVKVCGRILFPREALEEYVRRHLVNHQ